MRRYYHDGTKILVTHLPCHGQPQITVGMSGTSFLDKGAQQIVAANVTTFLALMLPTLCTEWLGHKYFGVLRTTLAVSIAGAELAGNVFWGLSAQLYYGHLRGFTEIRLSEC